MLQTISAGHRDNTNYKTGEVTSKLEDIVTTLEEAQEEKLLKMNQ